jgi:hypothetical protein
MPIVRALTHDAATRVAELSDLLIDCDDLLQVARRLKHAQRARQGAQHELAPRA